MRVLPNPEKEARNRSKHGWRFDRVGEIFSRPVLQAPDDRLLGYEHEARVEATDMIGMRVVVLVFEPVEMEGGELAVRPISLRDANRTEEQDYGEVYR
jgi:uncharacterized DUF497 family protein